MQIGSPGHPHLTYCTNIHPGESLAEVRRAVETHVARVKTLLEVSGPFGVGLRLSARAAEELLVPGALDSFRGLLESLGLYVFTINGFPYGAFHGERVKECVYRPDWLERERVRYSDRLAWILAALLPAGSVGSVSTVPGAFRARARKPKDAAAIAESILEHAATLVKVRDQTGKLVELALEPEPCCFIETTDEAVRFFEDHLFSPAATRRFAASTGLSDGASGDFLRRHLAVCVDACHLAVEFEDASAAVDRLASAGVRIGKIQVTAALAARFGGEPGSDELKLRALEHFADGVYLHQVVQRSGDKLVRHLDLPDAIAMARATPQAAPSEWRVHFHVPVFADRFEPLASTGPFLCDLLAIVQKRHVSDHLEVETYTWDVLPPEHRAGGVEDAIARELRWTIERTASPLVPGRPGAAP
jgi:hypothetical protein